MSDKVFVDSNVFIYLLSDDERKKSIACSILKTRPVISTQVISENVNVLIRKFDNLSFEKVKHHVYILNYFCFVADITMLTIEKALAIKPKYGYQWYDSTVLSAAVLQDCNIIYSEDMQHGQIIENRLKIINPFL